MAYSEGEGGKFGGLSSKIDSEYTYNVTFREVLTW